MRSRFNLPIVIAYAVIVAVVLGYLGTQMGGEFLFQPTYRVSAVFNFGTQLVAGDDVTVGGLRVGRIDSIQPVQGGARADLLIHEQYAPLYHDARAMIKTKNLLGETYIELNRGTIGAGPMPQGGTIGRQSTLTPVEIDQVLSVLDQDTRQQLVALIDNLGESVDGQGGNLNSEAGSLKVVAQSLETVARSLASQNGHLDTLLSSLTKVLETLAAWHSQLRQLIGDWDSVMRTLAAREGDLQGVIVNEDQVMAIIDQALSQNAPNGLHQAIAGAPRLVDSTNHYVDNGNVIFGRVEQNTTPITDLFYELASVMSGTDSQGNHFWRVYPISGGLNTISQPLLGQPAGGGH